MFPFAELFDFFLVTIETSIGCWDLDFVDVIGPRVELAMTGRAVDVFLAVPAELPVCDYAGSHFFVALHAVLGI